MQGGKQDCRHFSYISCFLNYLYIPMALLINYPPWLSDLKYIFNYASSQTCNSQSSSVWSYFNVQEIASKVQKEEILHNWFWTEKLCTHTSERLYDIREVMALFPDSLSWVLCKQQQYMTLNMLQGSKNILSILHIWDWKIRTLYHLRCTKVKIQTKNKVVVQDWVNYLFSLIHYIWIDKTNKKF